MMAVYLIRAGKNGPVKIGMSDDVPGRLRELQVAHHERLIVTRTVAGGALAEAEFHREFARLRIRGEWFLWDELMASFLPASRDEGKLFRFKRVTSEELVGPPDPPDKWYQNSLMGLGTVREWPAFLNWLRADNLNCARLSAALCVPTVQVFNWCKYRNRLDFHRAIPQISAFTGIPTWELHPVIFPKPSCAPENERAAA